MYVALTQGAGPPQAVGRPAAAVALGVPNDDKL